MKKKRRKLKNATQIKMLNGFDNVSFCCSFFDDVVYVFRFVLSVKNLCQYDSYYLAFRIECYSIKSECIDRDRYGTVRGRIRRRASVHELLCPSVKLLEV